MRSMCPPLSFYLTILLLMSGNTGASAVSKEPEKDAGGARHALLVGCTRYQIGTVPELWGPTNDIPLWRRTLVERFGFAERDVITLLGWPDEPERRPTSANIVRAFEDIIVRAKVGDQVVVVMTGHGAQVPVPEGEDFAANPEPDGMDEVFLPADVKAWTRDGVEGAIKDDQFGMWLDQFRRKGAHVWIVFDCCHSGSMSRAVGSDERPRRVRPDALGIPDRAIKDAANRSKAAGPGQGDRGVLQADARGEGTGSVVAFYAAQPFEETPELPRPEGKPPVQENYFGLLSYTVATALGRRQSPITYRELTQMVTSLYRVDRSSRPPTAFAEGDLDREVMGLRVWPGRSDILLSHGDRGGTASELTIGAGTLSGLARDSILAVHPPAGGEEPSDKVIGYVRIVDAGPFSSQVEPADFDETKAVAAESLPDRARCEVTVASLGDLRVKLAVDTEKNDAWAGDAARAALGALPQEIQAMIVEVPDPAAADWRLGVEGDQLVLRQGPKPSPDGAKPEGREQAAERAVVRYSLADKERLNARLSFDLQKAFKWQNVWRVAGGMGNYQAPDAEGDLQLEVRKLSGPDDRQGRSIADRVLQQGDWVEIRLANTGHSDLWVTLLYLDPNFGIREIPVGSLRAGDSMRPLRTDVTEEAFGNEGLVALAIPMKTQRDRPDFRFLEQEPLGSERPENRGAELSRGKPRGGERSPFEQLMGDAAFGSRTRSLGFRIKSEPVIVSSTWVTIPRTPINP